MKRCIKCAVKKPLTDFYAHPKMHDGHFNICKTCACENARVRRSLNDKVRAYDRKRYQTDTKRRLSAYYISRRWREENPDKYKAHYIVSNAIRDGRLIKPEQCELCGATENINGHHEDYTIPLQVKWLCAQCHHVGHAREGLKK